MPSPPPAGATGHIPGSDAFRAAARRTATDEPFKFAAESRAAVRACREARGCGEGRVAAGVSACRDGAENVCLGSSQSCSVGAKVSDAIAADSTVAAGGVTASRRRRQDTGSIVFEHPPPVDGPNADSIACSGTGTRAARAAGGAPATDHFGLALYYQRVGDYDNALAQYRALLEQNDASAEVHNNLGLLYQDRGDQDEAVKQFQRAIGLQPKYVKAHNNLGVSLMRQNKLDAAAGEFRVALAADPRNVESIVNLALVDRAAGRTADARELLRRAVAIDPRNAGSHYNLAVVADESGDSSTAIEHYRLFLRLDSVAHADLAARVRARLSALGAG